MNTNNVLLFILGISIQTILCANNWDVSVGAGNLKQFQPSVLTIEKGDTVTWNWISGEHIVISDKTEGETVFSANITERVPTASYRFTELGKHFYYCGNHGAAGGWGQNGRITVVQTPVVSGEATTEEPHLTSGQGLTTGFDATTASEPLTTGHEDLTTGHQDLTTQDITTESITTHDITSEEISTGVTTAEEISTGVTTADEISTGITTDEEISTGITTGEEITTGITTAEEITSSDLTTAAVGTSGDDGSITTGEEVTTDGITTEHITTQDITTQDITTEDITTEEITTGEDDITTEDITTGEDDLTTGFFTTGDITTGEDDLTTGVFVFTSGSTTAEDITSEGITTQDITSESLTTGTFTCSFECKNGGSCVGQDQCSCVGGYFGETCTSFICDSPCQNGGNCSAPNTCDCRTYQTGYSGSTCSIFDCDDNNDCTADSISGGTCLHSVISSPTCTGSHPIENTNPITVIIQNSAGLNEATLTVSSGALRDRDGSGREMSVETALRSQNSLPSTVQSVTYHTSGLMVTTPAYTEVIGSVSVCFYVDLTAQDQAHACLGYNANSDNTWTCQSHLSRKKPNYYCGTTNRLNTGFFAVITLA